MELLLKKDLIDRLADKHLNTLMIGEVARNHIRERISSNEIFRFFLEGINTESVRKLFAELQDPQIFTEEDVIYYATLMIKKDVLEAIGKALTVLRNSKGNLTNDNDKINLLIDLKNIDDPEGFQQLIADTLENRVTE